MEINREKWDSVLPKIICKLVEIDKVPIIPRG